MQYSEEEMRSVVISDYIYNPRHRESLSSSFIKELLEEKYELNKNHIIERLKSWKKYGEKLDRIPEVQDLQESSAPFWNNDWCSGLSAVSLYCMVSEHNPRYYVECGSGNSTRFVARAIKDNSLRTQIISIDPQPRAEVDALCHTVIRSGLEDVRLSFFDELTSEDFIVLDSSHRAFSNSDVTVFFTEILPRLPHGLVYAMHDIFLPYDYPKAWVEEQKLFYNEQYLLAAYLLGGAMNDTIELPLYFLWTKEDMKEIFDSITIRKHARPSFFWMSKG